MSYARFGADGSDVYVYASVNGVECCGCWLSETGEMTYWNDVDSFIEHMYDHIAAGHSVPEYLLHRDDYDLKDFDGRE